MKLELQETVATSSINPLAVKRASLIVSLLICLVQLSACTSMRKQQVADDATRTTIIVAARYLDNVVQVNAQALNTMISWEDYQANNKISKQRYGQELVKLRDASTPANHPLVNLDLVEAKAKGDYATVKFRKFQDADGQIITVKLVWRESAWYVAEDSVFGAGGLVADLRPAQKTKS